jgi:hypothetical protein
MKKRMGAGSVLCKKPLNNDSIQSPGEKDDEE